MQMSKKARLRVNWFEIMFIEKDNRFDSEEHTLKVGTHSL